MLLNVTYGVGTIGNYEGLTLNLMSVGMQDHKPNEVVIAFCSNGMKMPYYLSMAIEFLKVSGVSIKILYLQDKGISDMYQELIDNASHKVFWLGNDDVVYSHDCLKYLYWNSDQLKNWAFVTGLKPDIYDFGKYKDFSLKERSHTETNAPYFLYEEGTPNLLERMHPDLGNCLLNIQAMLDNGIRINFLNDEYQGKVIGDDWLLGALIKKKGLKGYTCTRAVGYHLEKEKVSTFSYGKLERAYLERTLKEYDLPIDILNELKSI